MFVFLNELLGIYAPHIDNIVALATSGEPFINDLYDISVESDDYKFILECLPTWSEESPRTAGSYVAPQHGGFKLTIIRRCISQPIVRIACTDYTIMLQPDFYIEYIVNGKYYTFSGGMRFYNTDKIHWNEKSGFNYTSIEFQLLCTPFSKCGKDILYAQARSDILEIFEVLEQIILQVSIDNQFSMITRDFAGIIDPEVLIDGIDVPRNTKFIAQGSAYSGVGVCIIAPLPFIVYKALSRTDSYSICDCNLETKFLASLPIIIKGKNVSIGYWFPYIAVKSIADILVANLENVVLDALPSDGGYLLDPVLSIAESKYSTMKEWYQAAFDSVFSNPLNRIAPDRSPRNEYVESPSNFSFETRLRQTNYWSYDISSRFDDDDQLYYFQYLNPRLVSVKEVQALSIIDNISSYSDKFTRTADDFYPIFWSLRDQYGKGKQMVAHSVNTKGVKMFVYADWGPPDSLIYHPLIEDGYGGFIFGGDTSEILTVWSRADDDIVEFYNEGVRMPDVQFDITAFTVPSDKLTSEGTRENGVNSIQTSVVKADNHIASFGNNYKLKGNNYTIPSFSSNNSTINHSGVRIDLPYSSDITINAAPPVEFQQQFLFPFETTSEIEILNDLGNGRTSARYKFNGPNVSVTYSNEFLLEMPHSIDEIEVNSEHVRQSVFVTVDNPKPEDIATTSSVDFKAEYQLLNVLGLPYSYSEEFGKYEILKNMTQTGIINVTGELIQNTGLLPEFIYRITVTRELQDPLIFDIKFFGLGWSGDIYGNIANMILLANTESYPLITNE